MNQPKLMQLAESKGMKPEEVQTLLDQAHKGGIEGLRAIRKLNTKLRTVPDIRSAVIDALPRGSITNLAINLPDMERTQIAAALLWLSNDHLPEVQEFLRWFKLPVVDDYDSLKSLMKTWMMDN